MRWASTLCAAAAMKSVARTSAQSIHKDKKGIKGGEHSSEAVCYHVRGVAKSGTTWLASLLDEAATLNCRSPQIAESETCLKGSCEDQRTKHTTNIDTIKHKSGKSVFIFRDTRDVLCSHYHWAPHGHKNVSSFVRDPECGIDAVIKMQNEMMHVVEQLRGAAHFTLTYYETLKRDAPAELGRIASFLHMPLSPAQIKEAVDAASFDAMRDKEVNGELKLKVYPNSPSTLKKAEETGKGADELFRVMTRKGEVGGFKDELDAALIVFVEAKMVQFLTPKLLKRYNGKIRGESEFPKTDIGFLKLERGTFDNETGAAEEKNKRVAKRMDASLGTERNNTKGTTPDDPPLGNRLHDLKIWHDEGILSDEEYSKAKAKALGI
jgi:hypothetical protein